MKKLIVVFIAVMLIPVFCFAEFTSSFILNGAAGVIDLASTELPTHTLANAAYYVTYSGNTLSDPYYDNQIIGTFELRNTTNNDKVKNITVSARLLSDNNNDGWYMTYEKDGVKYKRPFSLMLLGRQEKYTSQYGVYYQKLTNTTYGKTIGDSASSRANTTYSTSQYTSNFTFSNSNRAIMWDLVLVFDNNVSRETNTVADTHGNTFNLASSDENYYKALIQFTITYDKKIGNTWTNGITETYIVELKGTYNPTTTDQESDFTSNIISTLNVSRLSSADNLNILSLLESGTRTPVGSYHFRAANMGGNDTTRTFSLFLSSSGNGTVAGNEFYFKLTDSNGRVSSGLSNHNAVRFYAYMTSGVSGNTVQFDGQGVYSTTVSGGSITINGVYDSTYNYTTWEDYGEISVTVPSSQTINGSAVTSETLISGRYTGNIYIHVISNP